MKERGVSMEVLDLDATAMAAKIATRELSSLEAVNIYVKQLKKVNPDLNCMVENRFEQARNEAKEIDAQLKEGTPGGRLYGVPISMKESFDVAGMVTSGGLLHRRNLVADRDADVVASLKKEGAIILGKTNTPVLCFCQETENKLFGRTNNPWNLERTAGGSSGGEGALIAAGGAAVGVGSDIGGSIRFPSHFNGVIGFRSGNGQVSSNGFFPGEDHPLQRRMQGIGALARSVRDARLIDEIIALRQPARRELDAFTLTMPLRQLFYPADRATLKALATVNEFLKSNFETIDEQPPYYHQSAVLWQLIMSINKAHGYARPAFEERPIRPMMEYLKEKIFRSSDLHWYFTWALCGAGLVGPGPQKTKKIGQIIAEGDPKVMAYLDHRLLVLPVYHTPAAPHGRVFRELFSLLMTYRRYIPFVAYANTWGLPALVVPVAENEDGLPIGLQIISRVGNEDAIFKLGEIIAEEFRGYRRAIHVG
ncbi:MAG: amidase [Firmicutes bacterium]|nr:amidase [Bacillota bacterium]